MGEPQGAVGVAFTRFARGEAVEVRCDNNGGEELWRRAVIVEQAVAGRAFEAVVSYPPDKKAAAETEERKRM